MLKSQPLKQETMLQFKESSGIDKGPKNVATICMCLLPHPCILSFKPAGEWKEGQEPAHPNASACLAALLRSPLLLPKKEPRRQMKGPPGHSHAYTFLPNTKWLQMAGFAVVWPGLKNRDLRTICFHTILGDVLYFSP